MAKKHQLADLQLAIMQVLWDRGEATVSDVREALKPGRNLAHTTIGTMLTRMKEAGQVAQREDGRANVYRARLRREQVQRSMVTDLTRRLFGGDVTEMMCQLLDGESVGPDELKQLKRLIREREKELRDAE